MSRPQRVRTELDQIYVFKNFDAIEAAQKRYGFDAEDHAAFAENLFMVPTVIDGAEVHLPALKIRRTHWLPLQSTMPTRWAVAACIVLQREGAEYKRLKVHTDWPGVYRNVEEVIASVLELAEGRTPYEGHFVDMNVEGRTDSQALSLFVETHSKWRMPGPLHRTQEDICMAEHIAALSGWVLTPEMLVEFCSAEGATLTEYARYFRSLRRATGYTFAHVARHLNDELGMNMKPEELTQEAMQGWRAGVPLATDVIEWAREYNRPDIEHYLNAEEVLPERIIAALAKPFPFVREHHKDRKIPRAFVVQAQTDGQWYVVIEDDTSDGDKRIQVLLPDMVSFYGNIGRRAEMALPKKYTAIRCFGEADAYQRMAEFYAKQLKG